MNSTITPWVKVAIPGPWWHPYDYAYQGHVTLRKGIRVRVPFGQRTVVGYIVGFPASPDIDLALMKSIEEVLDLEPLFNAHLLELITQMSQYYHASLGLCFQAALPHAIQKGKALPHDPHCYQSHVCESLKQSVPIPHTLNIEQANVVSQLAENSKKFHVHVIHGVTGSGKTEIYCHMIDRILSAGQQVLILVPEIGLTPQMIERFYARFSVPVIEMHSMLTDKQRLHHYAFALRQEPCVVVGTRSAIFAPLPLLGGIIVDEEHDLSYKQQNAPHYHARDMAILRAKIQDIPIVLGSATPSLETYNHARLGHYAYSVLQQRAGGVLMPSVHLIDMRQQRIEGGLSWPLIEKIRAHLEQGQVLLFLNRRGYAPVLLCHTCGWVAECPSCETYYTLHLKPVSLICHHCGRQQHVQKRCGSCQDTQNLLPVGTGTEQIEEALARLFPEEKIVRVDRDVVQKKGMLQAQLKAIQTGEAKLIVGTQMLAKGHHFPQLRMVGIVDIDASLFSADFRSVEHIAQLIVQVAGRAGREGEQGEVFVQTHQVNHPLLNQLLKQGYTVLAETLLQERSEAALPPFHHLVQFRSESRTLKQAMENLHQIANQLKNFAPALTVLGPIPALMSKKAGRYRAELMIKSLDRQYLHRALHHFTQYGAPLLKRNVKYTIDVDPHDVL